MTRALPRLALLALALGAALRLTRIPLRWTEVAWQYAAYPAPTYEALLAGRFREALTSFTGLHPPLFSLLHALEEWIWPAPILWLGGSVVASLMAAAILARRHPLAALLLATSPVQVHYAAEVNNYPLVALLCAAIWVERAEAARPGRLAILGALAVWTHGLAGFVAGLAAMTLGARGGRVLWVMALASLPLLPGVWSLAMEPMTYTQPAYKFDLIAGDYIERFGLLGALVLPFAAMGARAQPALALGLIGTAGFVLALQLLGVAAPHQFPYLLALGAPLALLAEAGAGHRLARWGLVALALVQGLWVGGFDLVRLRSLWDSAPRAVDLALAEAGVGDAIVLLRPAPVNDDDKRLYSPVLTRISIWRALPMARPYDFDYDDFRHGQPRLVGGVTVYVHDAVRSELGLALRGHSRVWVVYSLGEDRRFAAELVGLFGEAEVVGSDLLFRVP